MDIHDKNELHFQYENHWQHVFSIRARLNSSAFKSIALFLDWQWMIARRIYQLELKCRNWRSIKFRHNTWVTISTVKYHFITFSPCRNVLLTSEYRARSYMHVYQHDTGDMFSWFVSARTRLLIATGALCLKKELTCVILTSHKKTLYLINLYYLQIFSFAKIFLIWGLLWLIILTKMHIAHYLYYVNT